MCGGGVGGWGVFWGGVGGVGGWGGGFGVEGEGGSELRIAAGKNAGATRNHANASQPRRKLFFLSMEAKMPETTQSHDPSMTHRSSERLPSAGSLPTFASARTSRTSTSRNLAGFCRNCLSRWYQEAAERARRCALQERVARDRLRHAVRRMAAALPDGRLARGAQPASTPPAPHDG